MSEQIPTKCPLCGAKLVQTDVHVGALPNRKKQKEKCHYQGIWLWGPRVHNFKLRTIRKTNRAIHGAKRKMQML